MSNVRMPIKTKKEGDTITKVCVEDIYKIINRVLNSMNDAYDNSIEILNSTHKQYDDYEGELIIGTGVSKPCDSDTFDEKVGNNIAFMKAKLNANIKKHNILTRIWNNYTYVLDAIDADLNKIDDYILMDLNNIREYNPSYLENIEEELGI